MAILLGWFLLFYVSVFKFLCCLRLIYGFIFLVNEWPPTGKIAAFSAYDVFSWYKYLYLIVNLVCFFHLGFWSGNLFLIAPFPDRCLLVPSSIYGLVVAKRYAF